MTAAAAVHAIAQSRDACCQFRLLLFVFSESSSDCAMMHSNKVVDRRMHAGVCVCMSSSKAWLRSSAANRVSKLFLVRS